MAIRTIDAPGIEIHEIDKSQYSPAMTGTKVLVTGFANSGEDYIPMIFTSKSAWLNYYGEPDNEAERYFYAASMEVLNQNGVVNCCKLPYENEARDKFVGFKYKLNSTRDVLLSTVFEQISEGGELEEIGNIISRSQTYQKDLIKYFLAEFNVTDATDKETLSKKSIEKEEAVSAQEVLESQVYDGTNADIGERSDGKTSQDVEGKNFIQLYCPEKNESGRTFQFSDIELAFREQMTKAALMSYAKEVDLTTSKILPDLPVYWKTETFETEESEETVVHEFRFADAEGVSEITIPQTGITHTVDAIKDRKLNELTGNTFSVYATPFREMVNAFKAIYPVLSIHQDTKDKLAETQYFSTSAILSVTDDEIGELSVSDVFGMATEIQGMAISGEAFEPGSTYADYTEFVKGQFQYFNDTIANGIVTDKEVVQNDGAMEQGISVLIPYLKETTDDQGNERKFVSYSLFETRSHLDIPYGEDPEDAGWFEITDLGDLITQNTKHLGIGIYDNGTPDDESDDALYVQFDSNPSQMNISEQEINELPLYYKDGYEWLKLSDMEGLDGAIRDLISRGAFHMQPLGQDDFDKAFQEIDELNENLEALNQAYRNAINKKLEFNEIRQADDTIDIAWKITAGTSPALYDMATIDEYRTDESRVGTNQILVVDKTRKTYGKVPEDSSHKNDGRELIGVIPIITTAANALYAQSMINVDDANVTDYETIHDVKTLDSSTQPYIFLGKEYKTHNIMQEGELSTVAVISQRFNNVHTVEDNDDDFFDSLALEANNYFSSISLQADGSFDRENMKKIGLVVVKAFLDASEGNRISFQTVESFVGELDRDAKNPNTGATTFIDTLVNEQSEYVNIFTNCMPTDALKEKYKKEVDILVMPHETADVASMGFYEGQCEEDIDISESILKALDMVYDKVTDINERDIDIVVDGGISNIAQFIKTVYGKKGFYDPASPDAALWKCKKDNDVKMWKTVIMKYDNFCKNIRKDCMFIADGPRPYCLQGQKKIVRPSKPKNTIDAEILPYTKYLTGINTSYGAGYCDWFQIADEFSGDYFWCPPSIKACGIYIYTDLNFEYWDAPAGLNRGIVAALDVAFSPTNKQAGQIYTKNWNYAINYPQDGIVLEGQKTLQTKPSALDRVNVRRLLLRLERATYKVLRYVVYEGNTAYMRQRVVDLLDPYFKEAKIGGGLYDYKIICDETNNTPTTIDRNELHISIGVKPVKTIEFIICNFVILSTGASWDEM